MNSEGNPQRTEVLDVLFEKKLNIKRRELIKHIQLTKLMAWEQVLHLALYARQQLFEDEGRKPHHFYSRIELLTITENRGGRQFLPLMTKLLDQGLSFLSLVEQLKEHANQNPKDNLAIKGLLSAFEEEQIAFSQLRVKLLYSHYAIKVALQDIVSLFQLLLYMPSEELVCDDITCGIINDKLREKNKFSADRSKRFFKTISIPLEEALKEYDGDPEVGANINVEVDRKMGKWMHKVFDFLSYPESTISGSDKIAMNPEKLNRKLCSVSQNKGGEQVVLTFDRAQLVRYVLMGQGEELLSEIGEELKLTVEQMIKKNPSRITKRALPSLSDWYKECRSLGLKQCNQIPRVVSAIIDFDIRNSHCGVGFFHYHFGNKFGKLLDSQEAITLTTRIVSHCLYFDGELSDFRNSTQLFIPEVGDFLPATVGEQNHLADSMMKTWAEIDCKKELERIKRPRKEVLSHICNAEKLIQDQKVKAIETRYPVGGIFPLPLWANVLTR